MNFHKLQDQFWQLYAVERFSGNTTLLYFYWLNRFNKGLNGEFWPVEYPRWSKQVEADLGLTDKPLAAARKTLEKRGLLYYREGSKSRAPIWSLRPIVRNNSGQSEDITRNNSGQSEHIAPDMSRSNSGQSGALPPALAGETPDSIRRRHKPLLEQEDTNKKNAGAGEDFFEEVAPPSPSQKITAPNPVALVPSPTDDDAELVLPPDDPAEARAFVPELAKRWHVSQQLNTQGWRKLTAFALAVAAQGKLAYLRHQFAGFDAFFSDGLTPHNLDKFCGHDGQSPPYSLGTWCSDGDWAAKAKDRRRPVAGTQSETPARASASPSTQKKDWR